MIMQNSAQQFNPQPAVQQPAIPIMNGAPIQSRIDGVALVTSDEQINNYAVVGGATVALIDLGRNLLVLKTNDVFYGKGLYYETYDIKKRELAPVQPIQNGSTQPVQDPNSDLMNQIQSEIASLKKEYNEIYKMLEELTAPKKEGK